MQLQITKEKLQEVEMLLNVIIDDASRINSGNVSHHGNSIKSTAIRVKKILTNEPKYKCYKCKDTGIISGEEYKGHSEGFVPTEKVCSCKN